VQALSPRAAVASRTVPQRPFEQSACAPQPIRRDSAFADQARGDAGIDRGLKPKALELRIGVTEHKVRRFAMHFLLGLIGRGAACLAYARSEAVRGRHAVWLRRQARNGRLIHPSRILSTAAQFVPRLGSWRPFPSEHDRLVTGIPAAVSVAAGSMNEKRFVRSAFKFLLAGVALVIIVGLAAIFYSVFGGGEEAKKAAAVQSQAGQQCPLSNPTDGYASGNVVFRLSNEVFPPSPSLQKEIHDRYGANVELADWDDLKAALVSEDQVRKFIEDTGIRLQSTNYDCDNILVSRSGHEMVQGLHYHLARHDGKVPPDWSVLDSIGAKDINLGRWKHSGQVLLRLPRAQ
jgi:hypothetical protein